jgi:pimeloyl-ACP methyl ester carboxylesterase
MYKPIILVGPAIGLLASSVAAQEGTRFPSVVAAGSGVETFVLVTGMIGGVAGFRRLQRLLIADGYRVVIIDPYRLSVDSADLSFAAMARRVDAVLTQQKVHGARVVGHSQGAGVALRLAAMAPDRVSALYLLDSGALPANAGPTLSASLHLVPLITRLPGGRRMVRDHFVHALRASVGRQEWLDTETLREYTEPLLDCIDRAVEMAFRLARAIEPEMLTSVVARVQVPVTVLVGAAPHAADMGPEELATLAPLGALLRVERLAGVGHFPHEEAPNELLPFLVAPVRVVGSEQKPLPAQVSSISTAGRRRMNTLPPASLGSYSSDPSWISANRRAIESPNPARPTSGAASA